MCTTVCKLGEIETVKFYFVHLTENSLQQHKEDGTGGSEVIIETPVDLRIRSEVQEFYAWLDEGINVMTEARVLQNRAGVTQVEVMVEEGMSENNDDTRVVPTNSRKTSKTKVTGEKRKRHCFSDVHTTFLEVQLEKGNLDRPEVRQKRY